MRITLAFTFQPIKLNNLSTFIAFPTQNGTRDGKCPQALLLELKIIFHEIICDI